MTYEIVYEEDFNFDGLNPGENSCDIAMAEIIQTNHEQIIKHFANPSTNFDKIHPATLITVISTNLMLNMFLAGVMKDELMKPREGNVN